MDGLQHANDAGTTLELSRFLAGSRWQDIPPEVRHEASRALLNCLGCALGGARHATVDRALAAIGAFSGPAQASVLGRGERLDAPRAALVNGISAHVLDFDDTHQRAIHVSAPVLPALLAYAEWRPVSGAQLLHAFVLGVEAECRIGLSVFPEHYDRGWHITGTAGLFGAAAAIGKLLNLNDKMMAHALGCAATQAAGLRAMFGSMCKSLHAGRAAEGGFVAAMLAASGFTSAANAIEAPRGFARVLSPRFDPAYVTDGLGRRYEISQNLYKPYSCGLWMHATIDGCIALAREHDLKPEAIERIALTVAPHVLELTGHPAPGTGLESKFSIYHAAAVALIDRAAGEAQFSDRRALDAGLIALRGRVSARPDPAIGKFEARIAVVLRDGRRLERHVTRVLGTRERPMSDRDLEDKFRALARDALAPAQANRLIGLCWSAGSLADAGVLARAAVPAA
jgi:2-methylcitrate dehydratase PrpD